MKRTIKLAAEAFKPANLARGLSAARNPVGQAALEHATPEQRAAYRAQVTRAQVPQIEDPLERLHPDHWFDDVGEEPIPYRYCRPLVR